MKTQKIRPLPPKRLAILNYLRENFPRYFRNRELADNLLIHTSYIAMSLYKLRRKGLVERTNIPWSAQPNIGAVAWRAAIRETNE